MASELNNEFGSDAFDSDAPPSELDLAIAEFFAAQDTGVPLDVPSFLKKHSTVADELEPFIHQQMQMGRLMSPVRRIAELANSTTSELAPEFAEFGDYTIIREIGRGGMGVIYEAQQQGLKRRVALKMIRENRFVTKESLIRFQAEAEAAAALEHTNIVPVFRVGDVDGRPFFTMKLVRGGSLKERLAVGPIPAKEAARIANVIADAVSFAHQRGILHRDLKPANILLDPRPDANDSSHTPQDSRDFEGAGTLLESTLANSDSNSNETSVNPMISDFGLAKQLGDEVSIGENSNGLTMTGAVLGTPSFMSPEQASGESALTTATDIYSVGAILFNMLTGSPPFEGKTPGEITRKVIDQAPRWHSSSGLDTDLQTICFKCLEKRPEDRYAGAAELSTDLKLYLAGKPILARRASASEQAIKWARRNPWLAATCSLAAALLLLTLVGSIFFSWRLNNEVTQRGVALQRLQVQETATARQRDQALRLLFESKFKEVAARRSSGESGHRIAALSAAKEAVAQLPFVSASEKEVLELRSETAGCLGNIDMVELSQWSNATYSKLGQRYNFSSDLKLVATHPFRGSPVLVYSTDALGQTGSEAKTDPIATFDIGQTNVIGGPFRLEISRCHTYLLAHTHDGATTRQFVFDLENQTTVFDQDKISHACVGYSDSGTLMAVADASSITIRRLPGLEKLISFPNPCPSTNCLLSFNPNGRWLALHGVGGFFIFDVSTGKTVWQNTDHFTFDLDWHPTEPEIAVTNFLSAKVWRLEDETTRLVNEFPGHTHEVFRVAYTPDGSAIATSTWNGNTRIWNVLSGEKLFSCVGAVVRFSKDGSRVAMQAAKAGIFRFEGERLRKTISTADEKNEASQPVNVDVHPDNRWVALGSKKGVRIGDLKSGTRLIDLPGPGRVKFHPDGSYLLTGWHSVVQWPIREEPDEDNETSKLIVGPPQTLPKLNAFNGMDLDPDGKFIAIINGRGRTLVMPIKQLDNVVEMQNSSAANGVSVSRGARLVAVGNHHSRNAQVFDGRTGKLLHTVETPGHARAKLSPSGDILAVTFGNSAEVYETVTWKLLYSLKDTDLEVAWPASFSPDGKQLLLTLRKPRGTLIVDAHSGRQLLRIPGDAGTAPRDANPVLTSDQQLVMIREGNSLESWDLARIRNRLAEIGLDWDAAREPARTVEAEVAISVPKAEIDWGESNRQSIYQKALRHIRRRYGKRAAELVFDDWQRDFPDDAQLWNARGKVHWQVLSRESMSDWSKALACEGCDPAVWYSRAIAGIKFNQRSEVVGDLTRFLNENPESVSDQMSASRLLAWELALNLVGRKLSDSDLETAFGLASAAKVWALSVERKSGSAKTETSVGALIDKTLALVHLRSGDPESAIKFLKNVSLLESSSEPRPAIGGHFIAGLAWHELGEDEKANSSYQQGLDSIAKLPNITANQAVEWMHLKSELASALNLDLRSVDSENVEEGNGQIVGKIQSWTPIELAVVASWDVGDVSVRAVENSANSKKELSKSEQQTTSETKQKVKPQFKDRLFFSTRRGGRLTLKLQVAESGVHDGLLSLSNAVDIGKFKFFFNGKPLELMFDGYSKSAGRETVRLEGLEFHVGVNELVLENVGTSPRSRGFRVGIEQFWLENPDQ